ncbi:MAG: phosphatidate cytidylyltransferase [Candidatus Omnitrophica bacterium]|nr:phosphatidate cytidylyltransferase [Candidatus Omnitrophota bacterium]
MVIKRIISGIVLIAIILGVIFVDWLCGLAVTAFIIVGLYEFFGMLEKKGICTYKYFGTLLGTLIPLSIMLRFASTPRWELLFIVLGLLALILMQFKRRRNDGVIVDISTTLFGILYISWFFSFLIKIRYLPGGTGYLASILLITKLGDIGAYFAGSRFGKNPLFPRISPKKTVEGSLAGLFFSVLAAFACQPLLSFSYPHLLLIGLSFGALGQLGDLSESLIKRDCGMKDSGKILPGMGGILDEIDSLLFNAPAFYFYISTVIKTY